MMLSKGPSRPGSLRPNATQHPLISIIVSLCSALLVVVTLVLVWAYCMPNGMSTRAALNHPGLWTSHSTAAMVDRAPIVSNMTQLQAAAALLDPVMMMHAPKTYDKRYKNPCWTAGGGMAVGQAAQILIMCLPYVYVSGYFTGIGSLIDKLNAHPNVVKDAGPFSPWGSDWGMWSEYRSNFPQWLSDIHSGGSTVAALDKWPKTNIIIDGARGTSSLYWAASGKVHTAFSSTAVAAWKECHDQFNKDVVKYEQCMEDVALPKGRAADYNRSALAALNYTEDQHLPLLMRALYGPMPPRLVVMVRNPVKRMYSNYFGRKNYHERYGNTSAGFTKFVDEQLAAWKACVEGDTLHGMNGLGGPPIRHTDADCYLRMESLSMREEKVFYHCDQLFRGLYAPYLRLWMRFLPRKHILVLRSSDYFAKPDLVTNQVLAFLGLPLLPGHPGIPKYLPGVPYMPLLGQQQLDSADAAHVRMAGSPRSTTRGVEPMAEGTRMALLAYYKPYNEQLAQLLDDPSILNWNTDPDAE